MKNKNKGYIVKATVYLHIISDYADGVGEAGREVRHVIEGLEDSDKRVELAHVTDMAWIEGTLHKKMTECDWSLIHKDKEKKTVLDDGMR